MDRAFAGRSKLVSTKAAVQLLRECDWLHKRVSRLSAAEVAALCEVLPSFAPRDAAIAAQAMAVSRRGNQVLSSVHDRWSIRRETLQLVREARQGHTATAMAQTMQVDPLVSKRLT